jgi:RNA polymerase sigma factor (sigma-70 family)
MDDSALLRQYVESSSDEAFATLVTRHINLVYSVALRRVGNPHNAEEITQAVFIILAKKAAQLREVKALSSWLFQATRLTTNNFIRSEARRHHREEEAYMQSVLDESRTEVWPDIAPLLDTAVAGLREKDRQAIVLRFYEGRNLRDIGMVLGASEDAMEKRINRALEKLRIFFTKRGVALSSMVITEAISANSVQAAPVALAKSVTGVAVVKESIAAAATLTLVKETMKMMTWSKIKFATVICAGIVVAIAISTAVVAQSKSPNTNATKNVTTDDSFFITPGVSVGKVKAGMTEDDVITALGEPERKQGEVLIYDKRFGFSVVCSRQKIVGAVFCGGGVAFKGHTKEGIGLESSRDDLIKAFGQPTSAKPWAVGQEQLEYKPLGLTFLLQNGKVFDITVDLRKSQ